MNLSPKVESDWNAYENGLRSVNSYLKNRIELLEHNQLQDITLLIALKGLQYCMTINSVDGEFKEEIEKRIKEEEKHRTKNVGDNSIIIRAFKYYHDRFRKDIFSDFFPEEEEKIFTELGREVKKKYYRVDPIRKNQKDPPFYFGNATCALEGLICIRTGSQIHLANPRTDIINVSKCRHFNIYRHQGQDDQFRCTHPNATSSKICALAYSANRRDCPNLRDLITPEEDIFTQLIGKIPTPKMSELEKP